MGFFRGGGRRRRRRMGGREEGGVDFVLGYERLGLEC